MGPREVIEHLQSEGAGGAAAWFASHREVADLLDRKLGSGGKAFVSDHEDEVLMTAQDYGEGKRPEDYIEGFRSFVTKNQNKIPALMVVTQRPRDLTRQQLKELKLELDKAGFSEAALKSAWRTAKNEDIAASIIGYIRQMAIGSPLMPYDERVDQAMKRIYKSRSWSKPQRKWLERIAKQLKVETVVDREALDRGEFKANGRLKRLNKVFDGKLEHLLGEIHEELWKDAG